MTRNDATTGNSVITHNSAGLLQQFLDGTIDAATFGHLEHLAVAYEMLRQQPYQQAANAYAHGINALATKAGAPDKFNMTITIAFMSLIAERMDAFEGDDFSGFIAQNPDLLSKDILAKHYSPERMTSALAKKMFLVPDRAA